MSFAAVSTRHTRQVVHLHKPSRCQDAASRSRVDDGEAQSGAVHAAAKTHALWVNANYAGNASERMGARVSAACAVM